MFPFSRLPCRASNQRSQSSRHPRARQMKPDQKKRAGSGRGDSRQEQETQGFLAPMPVWMFPAVGLLLFWGSTHLDGAAGNFSSKVYANYKSEKQLEDLQPKDETQKEFLKGKEVYGRTCVACHQPGGGGAAGQFPPLAGSDWVAAKSPDRLIRIVLDGLQGPIQVNGQDWNNVMVKWRGVLSAEEIASVLTYVRGECDSGQGRNAGQGTDGE